MGTKGMHSTFTIILIGSVFSCVVQADAATTPRGDKVQSFSPVFLATKTHNVGLLALRVTNVGFFGGTSRDGRNARWHGYEHLYLSGIWVGAVASDQAPHVSAAESFEFAPLLDPRWRIYESYEGQAHGFRVGLLGVDPADDDGDGTLDEDFQNGFDDDHDGQVDEDFQAIGQQMFSGMYQDDRAEFPLGLLLKQRSFQWSATDLNEMVGFEIDLINYGEMDLTDLYLGFYSDADVGPAATEGYWTDDLVGWDQIDTTLFKPGPVEGPCYTTMSVSVKTMFTWDVPDNGTTATGGDAPGVFGTVLTGHTTDVLGIRAPQQVDWQTATWIENPKTALMDDSDRYALLAAGLKPTTNPRSGVAEGSTADPGDYATLLSVGPFPLLHPGESVTLDAAHVVGDGFTGYRLNATKAQQLAATAYLDLDNDSQSGLEGKERCLRALEPGEPVIWNNPCDTLALGIEWSSTDCLWVDLDCNPCTGINGAEALIPWVGSTAPPYPNSNLDPAYLSGLPPQQTLVVPPAGNGRVIVQWDNLGETWIDQITGGKPFHGYRIWKVSDWAEPSQIPDPEDWVQLAAFYTDVDSVNNVSTVVNRDVDPIGIAHDGTPIYPVGRYAFIDSTVTNGHTYFYCVTSFAHYTTNQGAQEIAALPWTTEDRAVVPCDLCEPVPVGLLSFTAERVGGSAHLSWTIADPGDLAGFHVAREATGSPGRVRISEELVSGGPTYEFIDEHAPAEAAAYWLEEIHRDGTTSWLGPVKMEALATPAAFFIRSPAPNPFNAMTSLAYGLPNSRRVRISIHDLSGRRIRVLVNEEQGPGTFTVHWNGVSDTAQRAAPGLYILSVEAGRDRISTELLLLP